MKIKIKKFRSIIRQEFDTLIEAEEKKKGPGDKDKAKAQAYKDSFEEFGRTFVCPRHNKVLKTAWRRIAKLENVGIDDETYEKLKKTKNIIPPMAQSSDKEHHKDFPIGLLKQAEIFKYVPKGFFCPLMEEEAEMTKDDLRRIARSELPDAYTVRVYEDVEDDAGESVKDEDGRVVKRQVEKAMRCDYEVTPKWAKPGQISAYWARGEVAEEEEEAGRLHRDKPKRSGAWYEKKRAMATPEGAPKALLDKIKDMETRGYSYRWVTSLDAAEAVHKYITTHRIPGIEAIAIGDEAGKQTVEVITSLSRRDVKVPDTVGGFNVRVVSQPSLAKKSEKRRNVKGEILDPDFIKVDGQIVWDKDKAAVDMNQTRFKPQRAWTKIPLRRSAAGKPIFTSNDVHYLSGPFAMGLSAAKKVAGAEYRGPEPYYGMGRDKVEQLLTNMGWEMAESQEYGEEAAPPKGPMKWASSASTTADVSDDDDDSDIDDELTSDERASIGSEEAQDYADWAEAQYGERAEEEPTEVPAPVQPEKKNPRGIDALWDMIKDEK